MNFTGAKLQQALGDTTVTAGTLDPAHIKVQLYTGGPDPGPDNVYGDFTPAAGTNLKAITAWTSRLWQGNPTITSSEVIFVPGTDVNTGQVVKGALLVTDASPHVLIGSEKFAGDKSLVTSADVVILLISIYLVISAAIGAVEDV